jgi:hypothetical protein
MKTYEVVLATGWGTSYRSATAPLEIKADDYNTYSNGELIFTNIESAVTTVKVATFAKNTWASVAEKTEE